ncbi:MAG: hypothetical protein HKN12_10285, partial [Gemmatimonadetes bacterium]|nr:hypothetical protein [Gemmatimonadota bacterium]
LKVISLDQQQRRIVLSLKEYLDGVDDDVEMNFRAEVQKRSAERAQRKSEEAEEAAEPKFEGTDPDDSAFDEIEQSLRD